MPKGNGDGQSPHRVFSNATKSEEDGMPKGNGDKTSHFLSCPNRVHSPKRTECRKAMETRAACHGLVSDPAGPKRTECRKAMETCIRVVSCCLCWLVRRGRNAERQWRHHLVDPRHRYDSTRPKRTECRKAMETSSCRSASQVRLHSSEEDGMPKGNGDLTVFLSLTLPIFHVRRGRNAERQYFPFFLSFFLSCPKRTECRKAMETLVISNAFPSTTQSPKRTECRKAMETKRVSFHLHFPFIVRRGRNAERQWRPRSGFRYLLFPARVRRGRNAERQWRLRQAASRVPARAVVRRGRNAERQWRLDLFIKNKTGRGISPKRTECRKAMETPNEAG